jgi:hypothetical protein
VSSVATIWPLCHTPPRVVTHHSAVEKPNSRTSQKRCARLATPSRPSSIQHRPTVAAASAALTPDSKRSTVSGPKIATDGVNSTAGNGANGT